MKDFKDATVLEKLDRMIEFLEKWNESITIVPDDKKYLIEIKDLIEKQQKEIEELQKEIEKIIQILEAKPYTAYTLYGDILHESDEIAQMLKDVLENNKKEIEELKDKFSDEKRYREVIEKKDYISKGKIKAILKKYKYTEIGDNEKIIEFYKKMQSLLEEE